MENNRDVLGFLSIVEIISYNDLINGAMQFQLPFIYLYRQITIILVKWIKSARAILVLEGLNQLGLPGPEPP